MATKYIVNNLTGQTISEINSTTIISDTISATTYSNLPIPTYISSGPTAPGSAVVSNETDVNINFSDGVGTAWSFSPTGMTFPDDTVQTTAYEPKYKVYTALLTQNGGYNPQISYGDENISLGVTYTITANPNNYDLTIYGALNNNVGTSFASTVTINLPYDTSLVLSSNSGAPVVTVLENTIGNIWFEYVENGRYFIHGDFPLGKTTSNISMNYPYIIPSYGPSLLPPNSFLKIYTDELDGTYLIIRTIYTTGSGPIVVAEEDGQLNNFLIEIRVYN
jgi:hypothetical protein